MDANDIQFDASNGRILINDEYVINVEVEDFSGETDTFAGEFEADYPAKGVEAWYNEDVECIVDISLHRAEVDGE